MSSDRTRTRERSGSTDDVGAEFEVGLDEGESGTEPSREAGLRRRAGLPGRFGAGLPFVEAHFELRPDIVGRPRALAGPRPVAAHVGGRGASGIRLSHSRAAVFS